MAPHHPTSQRTHGSRRKSCRIAERGRKAQLDLRSRIRRTPDRELTANKLGPLAHAAQAIVPHLPTVGERLRIDALAVIPNLQPKLTLIEMKLHFDFRTL